MDHPAADVTAGQSGHGAMHGGGTGEPRDTISQQHQPFESTARQELDPQGTCFDHPFQGAISPSTAATAALSLLLGREAACSNQQCLCLCVKQLSSYQRTCSTWMEAWDQFKAMVG